MWKEPQQLILSAYNVHHINTFFSEKITFKRKKLHYIPLNQLNKVRFATCLCDPTTRFNETTQQIHFTTQHEDKLKCQPQTKTDPLKLTHTTVNQHLDISLSPCEGFTSRLRSSLNIHILGLIDLTGKAAFDCYCISSRMDQKRPKAPGCWLQTETMERDHRGYS